MADKPTPTAIATRGDGRTHFLADALDSGQTTTMPRIGHHGVGHSVLVFDKGHATKSHPVILSLDGSAFRLREYLTASEARTLAHALLMAASHTERSSLDKAVDAIMATTEANA